MARYTQILIATPLMAHVTFPIDMLRYDRCTPMHETDSTKITEAVNGDIHGRSSEQIELVRVVANKASEPTYQRWRSFGWMVEITDVRKENG